MHHFSVWAPLVKSCSVLINGKGHGESYPMISVDGGWWSVDVAAAGHGTDYQFLLDNDSHPYPDPRSAWQPEGVHGPSRILDHSQYKWNDQAWSPTPLSEAIIYELHIGTFTTEGTFAAAIKNLPALIDLGITHVELLPVNSFPGRWGWGYDGVSLYAPQEAYGGPEALKQLVNACHLAGLSLLLDVVYNHFGPVGNYTGKFAPYITEEHHTPWGGAVNFDREGSVEARRFFCDNALMWMRDYHFDGLRLDAVHAFVDSSTKHFLEQLSEETAALSADVGRRLVLIAESDLNDPCVVTPRKSTEESKQTGYGIDAQWSDDFHHALFAYLTGEKKSYYCDYGSIAQIAKALKQAFVFDGIHSKYRDALHGKPVYNLSAHRFLGYIQNHDQVGNRAHGDRLHTIVGMRKAKLAAAVVLTAPFVPMIFQGEEFAASAPFIYFADHDDPEMARAVSEGRCKEHAPHGDWDAIPDPEARESFEQSKLNWKERELQPHADMLSWYRRLIELRKSRPALRDGDFNQLEISLNESEQWLAIQRGSMQMLFNFSERPISIEVANSSQIVLATDSALELEAATVKLPPYAFAALQLSS